MPIAARRLLFAALTLLPVLFIVYLNANSSPITIREQVGEATIFFESDSDRVLFPGDCVTVRWQLESIKGVKYNGRATVGSGERESCTLNRAPRLEVIFQDDSRHTYRLPVRFDLTLIPALLLVIGLGGLAYSLLGGVGLVAVLATVVMWPLLRSEVNMGSNSIDHIFFAQRAFESQNLALLPPHLLFHVTAFAVHHLLPFFNMENAAFAVLLVASVSSTLVIYLILRWMSGVRSDLIVSAVSIGLLLVAPISIFTDTFRPGVYTALINPNVLYSPTLNILRPFALLLFWAVAVMLGRQPTVKLSLLVSVTGILATLAKPSYTIALLPALGLVLLFRFVKTRQIQRDWLFAGLFICAALTLFWQYQYLYASSNPESFAFEYGSAKIVFSPFEMLIDYWKVPFIWIMIDLLMSILFPLSVYIAYFRDARRDMILNVAWLVTIMGVSFMYLFIEIPGQNYGNLTWSAHITSLILFTVSAGFLLRQKFVSGTFLWRDWRFVLCSSLFLLHVLYGVF